MCESYRLTAVDDDMQDLNAYIRERHIAALLEHVDNDSFNFKEVIKNTIKGHVSVFARPTRYLGVVHHYIVLKEHNSSDWIVYEWDNEGLHKFWTTAINGYPCLRLGEYSLVEVIGAVDAASRNKEYSFPNYNCNHWVETVAGELGRPIKVHYNCATSNCLDPRFCHHADIKYPKLLRWTLSIQQNVLSRFLFNIYLTNRHNLDAGPTSLCESTLDSSIDNLFQLSPVHLSYFLSFLLLAWFANTFDL
uniref:Uncharacterized protein n=1 Tax=Plectus sambesii TaxID=2011161 RepID=A0A914UZT6_9BILA